MERMRLTPNLIEQRRIVCIPSVGLMLRVAKQSPHGEVLDIEYRWPVVEDFATAPAADARESVEPIPI